MNKKILNFIKAHKIWTGIIVLAVLWTGYFAYGKIFPKPTLNRYVLAAAQKGILISSVSGSGQMSAFHQLDLKPKVSGDITYVAVKSGDEVKTGDLIAKIDDTDALKAVRDAQANLDSAQIALQKTKLQSSQTVDQASTDLAKAYDDAFTDVTNAFLDLPSLVSDSSSILYNVNHSSYMDNGKIQQTVGNAGVDYKYKIISQFEAAKTLYTTNLNDYKNANRNSDSATIEKLTNETATTVKALDDAAKAINNLIDYISLNSGSTQKTSEMTADQSSLNTHISKTDSSLANLVSVQNSITTAKNSIASANQSFSQSQTSSFNENIPVDVQSAELTVTQKQNALLDAQNALADYYIRAPFDSVVASVGVKVGDPASSGAAVATLVTKQQVATITLNEIDAANVKAGDKTTLTFDALPDLTITGKVETVDTIGTVTQGVVNYTIQISLDTETEDIKPGMSVSATIITSEKPNVLLVPSSAIKTVGANSTVQMFDTKYDSATADAGVVSSVPPKTVSVQVGDSNDTDTEIISGLNEGDQVVVRTAAVTGAQAAASTAPAAAGGSRAGANAGGLFGTSGGGAAARVPR